MDFEKNVPEWKAQGTEPPESLKTTGFEAGNKPPAAFFNWFWSRVSACLTEIRVKLKGHAENKGNPHGVTAAQVGLDKVNNTPDTEKHVAFAQEAGVARKAQSALTIRFNGGRTEGTDQWTYDGSTSRSANITADKVGAVKKDLSNVEAEVFRSKAKSSGACGIPTVPAYSSDGVAYTATVEGLPGLYNGLMITIVPEVVSASKAVTLNVNGTGAKLLRLPLSFNNAAMTTPRDDTFFTAGRPITVQYDENYATGGAWKTIGKQRTSAQDLYGTVPLESGGTGATSAAGALEKLGGVAKTGGTMTGTLATNEQLVAGANKTYKARVSGGTENVSLAMLDSQGNYVGGLVMSETASTLTKPLTVSSGGTGNATGNAPSATKLATARTIRTNLGSTSTASFDGTGNVTPGVTGTLPVANGGTGNTTGLAASATKLATARTVRTNLSSTSTASFDGSANITPGVTGTLPVANGGTGAATAAAARANLGAVAMTAKQVTIPSSGWSNKQNTVSVSGVTASNVVLVTSAPSNHITYRDNGVYCLSQADGSLTFKCSTTPTVNLVAQVLILE